MKQANIAAGLMGSALSCYVFFETSRFPEDNVILVGPAFFPRFLAAGLLIFSLLLILNTLMSKSDNIVRFNIRDKGVHRAGYALLATIVYCILLPHLGFIICSIIYLAFMMILMKQRKPLTLGLVSVSVTLVVYTVFKILLQISLPGGILDAI